MYTNKLLVQNVLLGEPNGSFLLIPPTNLIPPPQLNGQEKLSLN